MERDDACAASAYRDARKSIWADDEDGVDLSLVEREKLVVVLEKNHALASGIERDSVILRIEERDGGVGLGAVEPAEASCGSEDVANLLSIVASLTWPLCMAGRSSCGS